MLGGLVSMWVHVRCVFMCEHVRMEARTTLDMFKLYPKPSPAPSIAVKTAEDVKDAIQH